MNKKLMKPTGQAKAPARPIYEGNDKHKKPWQRGRKGSLCTKLDGEIAQSLLDESVADGKSRIAVRDGRAYRATEHSADRWHGWPVGWKEVSDELRHKWKSEGQLSQGDIRRNWHLHAEMK